MNRKKRIETILNKNFRYWKIEVIDSSHQHKGHNKFDGTEESHFCVVVKIACKLVDSKLSIHRKINQLLIKEFNSGLHALEIKILN